MAIKVYMTRNFYKLMRKSFQNDEKWRLFYCQSTFGSRVIQNDLWRHIVDTKWCKITKKWNISEDFFCIELKLCTVVAISTKFHDISTVTFPWQHNGLQALSIQKIKSEFSPSRSVICSCCLFSGCELIWTLHSTSTRKSVRLWSNK